MRRISIIFLLIPSLLCAAPWGKDADLALRKISPSASEEWFAPEEGVRRPLREITELKPFIKRESRKTSVPQSRQSSSVLSQMAQAMIWFHQNVISRADGPRSHYVPSSSQYTLDAVRKYGFIKGYFLGCDRLMRENREEWIYPRTQGPYCELKYDPVP